MLRDYPRLKAFLKSLLHLSKSLSSSYRIKNTIANKVALVLPRIVCIDVGASYYPHPSWEVFRRSPNTQWIAVEPNAENLFYLKNWSWPSSPISVEKGLSELGGMQTLYITNVDTGSSLLEPVIEASMVHRVPSLDYFFPLKMVAIDTMTLQQVIDQTNDLKSPISIKLDTQGSEFSIIRGMNQTVLETRVFCVEIENTLLAQPIMKDSAPFYTVFEFFETRGFELVHLKPIQINAPLAAGKLHGETVLNECDAVFLLRPDVAIKRDLDAQLALLGAYIAYSLYGEALNLLTHIVGNRDNSVELKDKCRSISTLLVP
jgi:FkbM family methyltransferase